MLYRILRKINRDKFKPVVISLLGQGKVGGLIAEIDIPVFYLNFERSKKGFSFYQSIQLLRQILQETKPTKIQGWMYHGNLVTSLAHLFFYGEADIFWSIHNTNPECERLLTRLVGFSLKVFSKSPKKILYVSEVSRLQHESVGFHKERSQVIPNGFDVSTFQPSTKLRGEFRKEINVSNDVFLIGLVARFHPMKDHLNFLQAASLLCRERSDVCFVLAGSGVDESNSTLTAWIHELNIQEKVFLLGERQDINYINASLDIATVSSAYSESFPLVIGEAMASGIPCVVTDVGASAEIVGQTGFVVKPRSPESLFLAWLKVISMNSQDRYQLGMLARQRVTDLFALDKIIEQYEAVYTE